MFVLWLKFRCNTQLSLLFALLCLMLVNSSTALERSGADLKPANATAATQYEHEHLQFKKMLLLTKLRQRRDTNELTTPDYDENIDVVPVVGHEKPKDALHELAEGLKDLWYTLVDVMHSTNEFIKSLFGQKH